MTAPAFALFPRQERFVLDTRRFPGYVGGIGSGKSFAGGAKVLTRISKPGLGGVFAPSYPMLRDATQRTLFGLLDMAGIEYDQHKGENRITIPRSGHEILFRSLDNPDSVRGPNLEWGWIDEASLVSREASNIVNGRVRVGENPQVWKTFTPKGRNWCWEEYEQNATGDESDPLHPLYRVKTMENPELPADFATTLGYDGRFAAQELDGEFVAFEGLIYPMFQRDRNVKPMDCTGWRTILGGDIGARNPTALLTIRRAGDGRTHIERERYQRNMSSDDITDAICEEMQQSGAEVGWLDPSAKAYIDACVKRRYNVKGANNDVKHGIGVVTTAFADGLTVDPSCVNTIAEFESYAWQEITKSGEKDQPIKQNDHACFVAGTLVATANGERPIETVRPGQLVHTRNGLRMVLKAGMTAAEADVLTVTLSDGSRLTATGNHPVFVKDYGFKPLDTLRYGDIIVSWQSEKKSSSTASHSGAIQSRVHGLIASISRLRSRIDSPASGDCTKKSGLQRTVPSLKGTKSITLTSILRTTTRPTLPASRLQNISRFTVRAIRPVVAPQSDWRCFNGINRLRRPGIAPTPAANGIGNMGVLHGLSESLSRDNATNVAPNSKTSPVAPIRASARTLASPSGVALLALMTLIGPALYAGRRSGSTSTAKSEPAPVHVVAVTKVSQRPAVYNLTVLETPEYFANGVLVHNCDAARYALVGDSVPQPTVRLW